MFFCSLIIIFLFILTTVTNKLAHDLFTANYSDNMRDAETIGFVRQINVV